MTIKEKIEKKIKIAKADIKVCMDDFNIIGEVNSEYPIGKTHDQKARFIIEVDFLDWKRLCDLLPKASRFITYNDRLY